MIFDMLIAAAGGLVTNGGQVVFDDASGTWTVPAGVTSICAVAVGRGQNTAGGCLAYKNNIAVVPGQVWNVVIDSANSRLVSPSSINTVVARANFSSTTGSTGDVAFAGGNSESRSGGGAAGYAGNGAAGQATNGANGIAGIGGSGGSGYNSGAPSTSGSGGGVGLQGLGADGVGGTAASPGGGGGSGGGKGQVDGNLAGGNYGGGGGASSKGAIRIIWGAGRSFPYAAADTGVTMEASYSEPGALPA